jgi:hypothetical protein
MATKKDLRRPDLSKSTRESAHLYAVRWLTLPVIPYQAPATKENSGDFGGAMSSTIPMAAMFTRNKYIGWYVCGPEHEGADSDRLQGVRRLRNPDLAR